MKIKKRDGSLENLSFDKIVYRLKKLKNEKTLGVLSTIDVDVIAQKVVSTIYDGVSSSELDEEAARITIAMTENLEFGKMAARLVISNSHKNTTECFSEVMENLYNNVDKNGKHAPILSDSFIEIVRKNKDILNEVIDYKRDYLFDYFGYKTLEKSYLMKIHGKVAERPQHLYLRVAVQTSGDNIDEIIKVYNLISNHYYTFASPTLFNAGSRLNNCVSCFLLGTNDSIGGIYKTLSDCAHISKVGGGIGIHINNIRSKGAVIRGTNGTSDGIIPMLKVYNSTSTFVNQSGKRKGSFAIYLSPEHPDIMEFLDLRKNQGAEEMRARDLFLAMWLSDEFMNQVEKDGDWYLMDPDECPGLPEAYGEDFKILYWKYVEEKRYRKKIKAQEIWMKILESNMETGTPYLLNKDQINLKNNQRNLGTIKSSNLCVAPETMILTSKGYYKIEELNDQEIEIWNGKEFTKTIVNKTGANQELVKVVLSNGSEIECTPYHKFYIVTGKSPSRYPIIKMIDAKDLQKSMKLIKSEFPIIKDGCSDFPYPYEHGIFSADGTYQSTENIHKCTYKSLENKSYCGYHIKMYNITDEITEKCQGTVGSIPKITLYGEKKKLAKYISNRLEVKSENNNKGKTISIQLPMELKDKFIVPINCNLDIKLRWLEGLSDGDGCVCKSGDTTAIQISSIDKDFLQNVKYLLQTLGCDPKVLIMREACKRLLPNQGTGELSEYECKTCYRLLITSYDTAKLYHLGFRPKRLVISEIYPKNNTKRWIQVEDVITTDRFSDTYCFKEEKRGMGIFNGILTGQCAEIALYSDDKEYACCNLASIALQKFIEYDNKGIPFYNHLKLFEVARDLILPMNNIIDNTYYPVPETKLSNERHRPIGIGCQNLSSVYLMMRYPFESESAKKLNKEIFETIYFGCLTGSMELSKKDGPYSTFKGSPFSQGKFQFDMWSETNGVDLKEYLSGRWDWESLRKNVIEFGTRNSTMNCIMPTASSSILMGNTEACEQFDSCIFKRRVLSGEYMVVNKYLVEDLTKLKLWNKELKDIIIANNGSVQNIDIIPQDIQLLYKTVWEISMKNVIDQSAERSVFIDQTSSLNLFIQTPTVKKLTSMYFYAYKKGLKTIQYYLRSKSAVNSSKFTIDSNLEKKIKEKQKTGKPLNKKEEEAVMMCSIDNKEDCELCSA